MKNPFARILGNTTKEMVTPVCTLNRRFSKVFVARNELDCWKLCCDWRNNCKMYGSHWSRIEYDGTVGQNQNSQEMSQLCSTVFKYKKCHMKCHNCTLCSLKWLTLILKKVIENLGIKCPVSNFKLEEYCSHGQYCS